MQKWARLVAGFTLALLMISSYMLSEPPFYAVIRLFGISRDHYTTEFRYINESSERVQDGYLVWSSGCRIVDLPAWDPSLKGLVKTGARVSCPGKKMSRVSGHLHNRSLVLSSALKTASCCVRHVTRRDNSSPHIKNPDDLYKLSKCQHINLTTALPEDAQYILVKCSNKKGKTEKEIYSNAHSFIRKSSSIEDKLKLQTEQFKSGKLSVLLVGIDSISRLNLLRTMPKTVKYLKTNGWVDLKGYNKMDDNTFPNLMAILTGKTVPQIRESCWKSQESKMDDCPFLWKDFSSQGYITAYAEDEPSISTFNYHKRGFTKTPTDYYLRPFMLAAENNLKSKMMDGLHICMGPNYSIDHILDYAVDFATVFNNALYFALFWMNSFSHNDVNVPSAFDGRILKFLKDLEKSGTLNSTLVVLLSDHGMRFGKIRETFVGWLEERLPFIYFWFPAAFKEAHPDKYDNLITNKDRLSSPFDLHLMLKELIGRDNDEIDGCKSCASLLTEVAWNRTCEEAGIGAHWCTCSEYRSLPTEGEDVKPSAKLVVDHINSVLKNRKAKLKAGTECAPLRLSKVLSLRSRVYRGPTQLVILLETKPGGALFEATVAPDRTPAIIDSISRINSYAKHSYCVDDAYLKKYCYCRTKH